MKILEQGSDLIVFVERPGGEWLLNCGLVEVASSSQPWT